MDGFGPGPRCGLVLQTDRCEQHTAWPNTSCSGLNARRSRLQPIAKCHERVLVCRKLEVAIVLSVPDDGHDDSFIRYHRIYFLAVPRHDVTAVVCQEPPQQAIRSSIEIPGAVVRPDFLAQIVGEQSTCIQPEIAKLIQFSRRGENARAGAVARCGVCKRTGRDRAGQARRDRRRRRCNRSKQDPGGERRAWSSVCRNPGL